MSFDSSFVKCTKIHWDRKTRSSYLEPKGVLTSFYLLRNSMGGLDLSLRGRGVSRENMALSFQIPLPHLCCLVVAFPAPLTDPGSAILLAPWNKHAHCPGGIGNHSTMNVRVSNELGHMTSPGAGGGVSSTRSFL